MPTITTRALRGSAVAAIAAIGVLGLAACSGGDTTEEEPTTSSATEESPAETSAAPEETEAAGAEGQCTAAQVSALTGTDVPEASLAGASGTFEPAAVIGDLPTECVITLEAAGTAVSYAVLPGGAATLASIVEQGNAAGGQLVDAGGQVAGTVGEVTVAAGAYDALAQGTGGFENTADLIVVLATPGFSG